MASWSAFAAAEPDLAAAIRALLQQYGPGMGYLATVRPDGGPRVHPVSPVITDEGLFCFIVDSAKRRDLERDGRYALHSYPPEESDDEAYLTGRAHLVTDPAVVSSLADALHASPEVDWRLFEFSIETAMLRRHGPAGALPLAMSLRYPPITLKWHEFGTSSATPSSPQTRTRTTVTLATPTLDRSNPTTSPHPATTLAGNRPAAAATSPQTAAKPSSRPAATIRPAVATVGSRTDTKPSSAPTAASPPAANPTPPPPTAHPIRAATLRLNDLAPATTSA